MHVLNTILQQLNLEGLQQFLSDAVTRLVQPFKDKGGRISVKNIVNRVFTALQLPVPTADQVKSAAAHLGRWYRHALDFFVAGLGEVNFKSSALVNRISVVIGNFLSGLTIA